MKPPSKIRRCFHGRGKSACRCTVTSKRMRSLLDFKCVEFVEDLMYGQFSKKPSK